MAMTITLINIAETMIIQNKINLLTKFIIILFLSGCAVAPGMYLETTSSKGVKSVKVQGLSDKYIEVEEITQELINSMTSINPKPISNELKYFSPSEYLVGSGDVLSVTVWGPEELFPKNLQLRGSPLIDRVVRKDGSIFYPYAGEIKAAGLTRETIRKKISTELEKSFLGVQVDVSISEFNSQKAILSGAFIRPGNIRLNEVPITLSEAISQGGSPSEAADLSRLKLIRDGSTFLIDYEYYARTSSEIHEIFIKNGDVIHIPFDDEKKVYVVGEVNRPIEVSLRRNNIPLSDALAKAGGISNQTASGYEVYVIRRSTNVDVEPRVFQIDMKNPASYVLASDFKLQPQDIVFVGPANIARWNRVISQFFPFTSLLNAVDNLQQN